MWCKQKLKDYLREEFKVVEFKTEMNLTVEFIDGTN